jgi:hypothetical protein
MSLTELVKSGFVQDLQNKAKEIIKEDRDSFNPVWNVIEQYTKQNQLIISDKFVLTKQQDSLYSLYEKAYKIYTDQPFKHANNLTNLIHKETKNKYIRLKTIYEHEELAIEYNLRIVCTVHKLQSNIVSIVHPEKHEGQLYLSPEIELIDIYRDLYTLNNPQAAIKFESALFEIVEKRKEEGILGRGSCKENQKDLVEGIKVALVKDWLYNMNKKSKPLVMNLNSESIEESNDDSIEKIEDEDKLGGRDKRERPKHHKDRYKDRIYNSDSESDNESDAGDAETKYILIGSWVMNWYKLGEQICTNTEKVQIVGNTTPDQLKHELQAYISQINANVQISYKTQELHIPKDFRTTRYTYYIRFQQERGTVEKPFLDFFNSASFELVPYHLHNDIRCGHKYFVLRFLFIDLWVIRIIRKLGVLNADILDKKLNYLWSVILYFRNLVSTDTPEFIGTYRDFAVDKKLNTVGVKVPYPYYPEMYFEDNKKYRDV